MKAFVTAVATGVYTGYFPFAPGTAGTIPAWILAWFWLGRNSAALLTATIAAVAVSVWVSTLAEPHLGHDSKKIVIDEWAGMFIGLLFLPYRLDVYLAAFVLFRFYDVIKPFPAGYCESLPIGWGVTMDDVVAGVYANLTCWAGILVLGRLGWLGF
jgi:phosphatidylglycerophosphatase A